MYALHPALTTCPWQTHVCSNKLTTSFTGAVWLFLQVGSIPQAPMISPSRSHQMLRIIWVPPRCGGGGGGGTGHRGYFSGPPKLLRARSFYSHDFYLYGLHLHAVSLSFTSRPCLDSMSELLGRIISSSNAFMVTVDKLFDVCKHVKPTPLIDHTITMSIN